MTKILGSDLIKRGMAQMQKGGVIMDVVNAEQARQKLPARLLLWRWNVCLPIFVLQAE